MPPIINSLLDTDFNKFTMAQAVFHKYPATHVRYKFFCRNGKMRVDEAELNKEIDHLCKLRFSDEELAWLESFPFFKSDFIEYLRLFHLNRHYITVADDKQRGLQIDIKGPWISTILFEVPVLAIVNEIYSRYHSINENGFHSVEDTIRKGEERLTAKIDKLTELLKTGQIPSFRFAEIGTRRRYSHDWHARVLDALRTKFRPHIFVGASNPFFAMKYKIKPIGTMTHEWIQAHQQLGSRLVNSQMAAMEAWAQEYRGELGVVVSDTVGFSAFLRDFDLYFAKLFDGCRHDSGDPETWCVKLIEHYDKLGIDPKTKFAVFTDGMDLKRATDIHQTFHELINLSFGIGTNLTNDMGIITLHSIIKMVECNGQPVTKVCDTKNKNICEDPEFESYLKKTFQIQA